MSSRACAPSTSAPSVAPRFSSARRFATGRPSRTNSVVARASKGDNNDLMRRAGAAAASVATSIALLVSPAVAEPLFSPQRSIATLPGVPTPPAETKAQPQASSRHAQEVPSNSELLNAVADDNSGGPLDGSIKSAARDEAAGEARRGNVSLANGQHLALGALPGADFLAGFNRAPTNKAYDDATDSNAGPGNTKNPIGIPSNAELVDAVTRDNPVTPAPSGAVRNLQTAANEERAAEKVSLLPGAAKLPIGALPGADFLSKFFAKPTEKAFDTATDSNAGPGNTKNPIGIPSNAELVDAVTRDNPVTPAPSGAVRNLQTAANEERAAEKVSALSVPGLPAARTGALIDFPSFFNSLKNTRPTTKGFDEATNSNAGPGNTKNPIGIPSNAELVDAVTRDNPVTPAPSGAVRNLQTAANEERAAEKVSQ